MFRLSLRQHLKDNEVKLRLNGSLSESSTRVNKARKKMFRELIGLNLGFYLCPKKLNNFS